MQYWEGDKGLALSVSRFIADLQQERSREFGFMFSRRFDASPVDRDTLSHVGKKFDIYTHRCRARDTGWPAGCNAMASDMFVLARERWESGEWKHVSGIWLLEADTVPLRRSWLSSISVDWAKAREDQKLVMGAWTPGPGPIGHVNGNLMFHPSLAAKVKGLEGAHPHVGWDVYHAAKLQPWWRPTDRMANFYGATRVKEEDLYGPGKRYCFVHGVKDHSAMRLAREKIFGASAPSSENRRIIS